MLKKLLANFILYYFRFFARLQLKKNRRSTIIGITGSAGKTSTRYALLKILSARGKVKHSENANSESGIPLNILGLSPRSYSNLDWLRLIIFTPFMLLFNWEKYDYYIVEMGIDSPKPPKNMDYLLSILVPDIGVVLNAELAHSANFEYLVKDQDPARKVEKLIFEIAREKMKMVHRLGRRGVAIYNRDDKSLLKNSQNLSARQFTFGKSQSSTLRILKIENSLKGFNLKFSYQGQIYELHLPDFLSEQYAYTFCAAISVAASLGISPSLSLKELSTYRAPAGRLRLFHGIKESTIIDSSYNANPSTMQVALSLLKKLGNHKHKIAILGDIRELGGSEKIVHKELADWIPLYCNQVILFGPLTLKYTLPILKTKKFPVRHFKKMSDLINYLRKELKARSIILVKGSQNQILLERAVESILASPNDASLLCRRGSYWDAVRHSTL